MRPEQLGCGLRPNALTEIITNLPQMLAAFDTIDALAGPERLIVAGHDPEVANRFKPTEPGIIRVV